MCPSSLGLSAREEGAGKPGRWPGTLQGGRKSFLKAPGSSLQKSWQLLSSTESRLERKDIYAQGGEVCKATLFLVILCFLCSKTLICHFWFCLYTSKTWLWSSKVVLTFFFPSTYGNEKIRLDPKLHLRSPAGLKVILPITNKMSSFKEKRRSWEREVGCHVLPTEALGSWQLTTSLFK